MNFKHNPKLTERAKELRKNMTKEEGILWHTYLKKLPVRILRQKVIDNYIVDFYCAKANLVIELDGSQHFEDEAKQQDDARTEHLEGRGLKVIRIPNNYINKHFREVCEYINIQIKNRIPPKSKDFDPL